MKSRIVLLTALIIMASTVLAFADMAAGPVIYMLVALPYLLIAGAIALICLCIIRVIKKRRNK